MANQTDAPQESSARVHQVVAALVAVAVIVVVLIAIFASGSTTELRPGKPVPGKHETEAMLHGVPQTGFGLGSPHAPVTIFEYGDLQCPSCAAFATEALPGLIEDYVRKDKLRIVFRPLEIIGPDSLRAVKMAAAVGAQNKLWQFVDLMYRNQGAENSSYVTDTYLKALASAISGVNVRRALIERNSTKVADEVALASAEAHRLGVTATPSFTIARTGGPAHRLSPASIVESSVFEEAVERELARR